MPIAYNHNRISSNTVIAVIALGFLVLSLVFTSSCSGDGDGQVGTLELKAGTGNGEAVVTANGNVSGEASAEITVDPPCTLIVTGGFSEGGVALDIESSDGTLLFSEQFKDEPSMPKISQSLDAGVYTLTVRTKGATGQLEVRENAK